MTEELHETRQIREALNRHGVFLKKAVIETLQMLPGLEIVGEEIGGTFGGTRVADIVARQVFRAPEHGTGEAPRAMAGVRVQACRA